VTPTRWAASTVSVDLVALYEAGGLVAADSYKNPGRLSREIVCVANTDVAVTFDLTIVRDATQGFFDVAVTFRDIFCSAKKLCGSPRSGDSLRAHFDRRGDHAERGDPQRA